MKPGTTTWSGEPRVTSGRCFAARSAYGPTSTMVPSRWKMAPSWITDASVRLRTLATTYLPRISDDAMARLPSGGGSDSKRVGAHHFPVVALAAFLLADRAAGTLQKLLDVVAGAGRRIEKQDAAGLGAGALPGMRDVAREERAGARPADGHLIADPERDLTGQHPGDLVAVAVEMEQALGADGHGFLEQHDAGIGLVAQELQGGEAAGRSHVEMFSGPRWHDETLRCRHVGLRAPVWPALCGRNLCAVLI